MGDVDGRGVGDPAVYVGGEVGDAVVTLEGRKEGRIVGLAVGPSVLL